MPRINIPFVVDGQFIKQWPKTKIAAGGQNYFYAIFNTHNNDPWGEIEGIKASFKCDDMDPIIVDVVRGSDNSLECLIPWEVMAKIGYFDTGMFGGDRLPTTMARTFVTHGCVCDGNEPQPPTQDWFKKIEDALNSTGTVNNVLYVKQNLTTFQKLQARENIDALGLEDLPEAINIALAQAKESGEFNGKDGAPGKDGINGIDGKDGAPGKDGINGIDGKDGAPGKDGINGIDGKDGATPNIQIGTVTTLPAGSNATVQRDPSSPDSAPVFNFGIPKGDSGESGSGGIDENTSKRIADLEKQMADLLYKAISIGSFSHDAGTKEMGSKVSTVVLSWATNKTPIAITLDNETVDPSLTSKTLSGLDIKANRTWTLKVTDERNTVATKTTTVSFLNGVYYGAAQSGTVDSAFILKLTKKLSSDKVTSFTANAGGGQHLWYALPVRMGTCKFTVGGFEGGFDLIGTISFTNASGYTEDYYVYRSSNDSLGNTTVGVS